MSCSQETNRFEMVLMDEDDEIAFDLAFDNQPIAASSQKIIDPRFEILVAINEANDSFEVNHEGFQKVFQANHPLRVHACIGHYANSSLISKVLEYALTSLNSSTNSNDPEEIAQIFSVKSESVNQKCIVAWAQEVPGELLEGKTVHHVFLDIWGKFETDDPLYVVLAGICTAITTSIVHIQKIELEDSTWKWMHKVALIAKKVAGKRRLEKLIFFVLDWGHPDKFMPGARGGREYLKNIYEKSDMNNDSCNSRIQHLKQLFESTSCYLFPFKSDQTSFAQHWTSSKGFLLYEGSGSEICLPVKEFYGLEEMLRLEKPQDYLSYLKELQDTKNWIEVTDMSQSSEQNEQSSPAQDSRNNPTSKVTELHPDFHLQDCTKDFESTFDNDNIFDDDGIEFADFEGPEFLFEPEFEFDMKKDTSAIKRFTLQEYLAQSRPQSNGKTNPEQEVTESDKFQHEQPKAADTSAEELLLKMIQNNPFEKLSSRIKIPSIEVPNSFLREVTPNSPNTETKISNSCFDQKLSCGLPDTQFSGTGTSNFKSDYANCELLPKLSRNSNLEVQETFPGTLSPELIELALVILSSMDLETLFTASVEMIVSGIIEEADEEMFSAVGTTAAQQLLLPLVNIILSDINSYTDAMDSAFKKRIFFQTKENLQSFSRSLINRVHRTRAAVLTTPACQNFLNNMKCQLEQLYSVINEEIRAKEDGNIDCAMKLALEFYELNLSSSIKEHQCSSEDTLSRAHEKWSSLSRKAFVQAYGGPEEIIRPFMQTFDENLQISKSRILSENKMTKELQVIQTLQAQICERFESELERSVIRNVSISKVTEFISMSHTTRINVMQKFNPEMHSLSAIGHSELKKCLEKALDKIHENKLIQFQAQSRTQIPPRNFQNSTYESSSKSLRPNSRTQGEEIFKPISAQVGVHFGFEYLSAAVLIETGFRNLYGPHPNVLTFTENEILIGEHPTQSSYPTTSLHLRNVLNQKNLNVKITTSDKKAHRVEEILAQVLSRLHLLVTESLHNDHIAYIIAVPSSFNPTMMDVMRDAIQIGGIEGAVIKESYGLVCSFLHENSRLMNPKTILISIIENPDDSAEASCFILEKGKVKPFLLLGYDKSTNSMLTPKYWVYRLINSSNSCLGITRIVNNLLNDIPNMLNKNSMVKVLLQCSNQNQNRNMDIIKRGSKYEVSWKVHTYSDSIPVVAEGAAFLAGYKYNAKFRDEWNKDHPKLGAILEMRDDTLDHAYYRLDHYGCQMDSPTILDTSRKVQEAIEQQRAALNTAKAKGKKIFMEKTHEIQDREMSEAKEKDVTSKLSELLRRIDGEFQSAVSVTKLIAQMQTL